VSFKTRFISFLMLLVMLMSFAFSGCGIMDVSNLSLEELMQPPTPDVEKYEIKLLLDTVKKGTVTFSSPKSGVYTTACTEYDIDGDGSDEAVVFYQEKTSGVTELYIHLFHKGQNGWESLDRHAVGEDDIFLVDFYDLDDDDNEEIIVLWENTEYEQAGKTLAVYEYDKDNGALVFSDFKDCEDFTVVDLQNDKKFEIVTVSLKTNNVPDPKADVFQYSDGKFEQMGETLRFDKEVTGYESISSSDFTIRYTNGKKTEYFPRVMVDCSGEFEGGVLRTYMIYCEKETGLEMGSAKYEDNPQIFEYGSEQSTRNFIINSRDINDDGIVDLPAGTGFVNTIPSDTTGLIVDDSYTEKYIVSWMTFDGTGWPISEYTVLNSEFNYILTIPVDWVKDIYFEDNSADGEYVLKKWNGTEYNKLDSDEKNEIVEGLEVYLKVKVFKADYWEASKDYWENEGYAEVDTNKAGTLVYAMYKGNLPMTYKVKLTIDE